MKARQRFRQARRAGRKAVQTKVSPHVFLILILIALVTGAIAISVNLGLEDWEKTHYIKDDGR